MAVILYKPFAARPLMSDLAIITYQLPSPMTPQLKWLAMKPTRAAQSQLIHWRELIQRTTCSQFFKSLLLTTEVSKRVIAECTVIQKGIDSVMAFICLRRVSICARSSLTHHTQPVRDPVYTLLNTHVGFIPALRPQ